MSEAKLRNQQLSERVIKFKVNKEREGREEQMQLKQNEVKAIQRIHKF